MPGGIPSCSGEARAYFAPGIRELADQAAGDGPVTVIAIDIPIGLADTGRRWVDDLALSGAELAAISAPVLLVRGRDDRVVPWRVSSAQLVDLLPDARLHVLSGCGHWTMIEKTADFLAVVRPFLGA